MAELWGTMGRLAAIGVALAALALAGCGGGGGEAKGPKADEAALRAALVEYLRVGSMDMKPEKFESVEAAGDQAVAKVRMATKDDLYGMKPLWTITFERAEKGWRVADVKR
jgi:hypothetical protein